MDYPKWKHHKEHKAKLVQSEEHFKSLGEGWGDDSSVWRPHLIKPEFVSEEKADAILAEVAEKPKAKAGRPKSEKA